MNRSHIFGLAFCAASVTALAAPRTVIDPATGLVTVIYETVETDSWTAPAGVTALSELLVVGGGGGGGSGCQGGGGGGGGVISLTDVAVVPGTAYAVTVGKGGAPGIYPSSDQRWAGDNGDLSAFDTYEAAGGGGGGGHTQVQFGRVGANGGGSQGNGWGANGTDTEWYVGHKGGCGGRVNGDPIHGNVNIPSGGGGAAENGHDGVRTIVDQGDGSAVTNWLAGAGGDGVRKTITGAEVWYGCGGGGGGFSWLTSGEGGNNSVSGGHGGQDSKGQNGLANTGCGGGGVGSSGPGPGGTGGSGIVAFSYVTPCPLVTLTGYSAPADGKAHTFEIKVLYPTSGVTVLYAASEQGPWTATKPTFSTMGTHTVWVKVSADGLQDAVSSVEVNIIDPSADNPGCYFFVVPAGTSGNTPASPYATWATAANDIQTAIDAAATYGGGTREAMVFVAPGTYAPSAEVTVSMAALTVKSFARDTGALSPETTIIDAGWQDGCARTNRCLKIDKVSTVRGFTLRNGYAPTVGGGGAYVSGGGTLQDCVVEDCRCEAVGGGLYVGIGTIKSGVYTPSVVRDCIIRNNLAWYPHPGDVKGTPCESCNAPDAVHGGGVHIEGLDSGDSLAHPLVRICGCTVTNNTVACNSPRTGGMHVRNGAWVEGCLVGGNRLVQKGIQQAYSQQMALSRYCTIVGCTVEGSSNPLAEAVSTVVNGVISNCTFRGNSGGTILTAQAASNRDKGTVVYGCVFSNNTANCLFVSGLEGKTSLVRNCLFLGNAGATALMHAGYAAVENCTVSGSKTGISADASVVTGEIVNTIASGNTTDIAATATGLVYRNCCASAFPEGATVENPVTEDAKLCGDGTIRRTSPCCDHGVMLGWMTSSATDLAGNARVVTNGKTLAEDPSALPDIGCYECGDRRCGLVILLR